MAVAFAELVATGSGTDGTVYTESSFPFVAGRGYVVIVSGSQSGSAEGMVATSASQTFVEQHEAINNGLSQDMIFVQDAAGATEDITFTYGEEQRRVAWQIYEITGQLSSDMMGTGGGTDSGVSTAANLTVTFEETTSGVIGSAAVSNNTETFTEESGWTKGSLADSTEALRQNSQWRVDDDDTSFLFSFASSNFVATCNEIRASVGGTAYTLAADAGSFTMTGTAMSPILGRKVAADAGAYAFAGQNAGLVSGQTLAASAGAFTMTGSDAGLVLGLKLAAAAGVFDLTGSDAGLIWAAKLAAAAGAHAVAGQDAGLILGRSIAADAGAYTMTGSDAGLVLAFILSAASGSYTFTGSAADLAFVSRQFPELAGPLLSALLDPCRLSVLVTPERLTLRFNPDRKSNLECD